MNSDQIVDAMKRRLPVQYDGRQFDRILEYVLWFDNDRKRRTSVVLLQGNSSFRVPAEKVELLEGNG